MEPINRELGGTTVIAVWSVMHNFSTLQLRTGSGLATGEIPIGTCVELSKDIAKLVLKTAARVWIYFS